MKPRRWYSSPEVNPSPEPQGSPPFASLIQLAYAARTHHQQGPIIKLGQAEARQSTREGDPQAPAVSAMVRRIDAA
jgi:hypothetical protein